MNHFYLWVGSPESRGSAGAALLPSIKDAGALQAHQGEGWSLTWAAQRGAVAAAAHDRFRAVGPAAQHRALAWFGHAWCEQGAHVAFESLGGLHERPCWQAAAALRQASDGVYAVVVADARRREIAVASDLLGSFHVYYRRLSGGVAVCSSSALLAALEPRAEPDAMGVQELCSLAVANEDRSTWAGVRKLRGSEILAIDIERRQFSSQTHRPLLAELRDVSTSLDEAVSGIGDAMGIVLRRMRDQGGRGPEAARAAWAADLTGGNDSRALMAALLRNGVRVVATVSGSEDNEDVVISARLARIAGIPYVRRPPAPPLSLPQVLDAWSLTDGEFDAIEFAGVAGVHRQHLADGLQFSVNGSYGETGRGYPWRLGPRAVFFPDRMARRLIDRTPIDVLEQGRQRFRPAVPAGLFTPAAALDWSTHGGAMIGRLLEYTQGLPQCAQLDLLHVDLRMERWQGRIASSTNQLWPAVSPWGFQGVLRRLLTASPLARRNSLLTRAFTAALAPELADELLFTGNPARPFDWRHAMRFVPAAGWYAKRARQKLAARFAPPPPAALPPAAARQPALCADPEFARMLAEPALAATGLFDPDALRAALDPRAPRSESAYVLWRRLVTLELGLRRQAQAAPSQVAAATAG